MFCSKFVTDELLVINVYDKNLNRLFRKFESIGVVMRLLC